MHYCVYVFIPKKGGIEELVASALQPFCDSYEVPPYKEHLDTGEVAAMAKYYGVRKTSVRKLAGCMEDWNGGRGGVDELGLFAIKTWNPDGKWDWYEIGGRWDGRLPGNVVGARVLSRSKDLANRLPAKMITPDGKWHAWESYVPTGWFEGTWARKKDSAWFKEMRRALANYPECRVVCVDIHS